MDIVAAILERAQRGALKTQLMYGAFISHPQLKDYLILLMERDLLDYNNEDNVYTITDSGNRFLKMYKEVDSMVPRENMLTKIE
jgi:predicted transcriptional regulator